MDALTEAARRDIAVDEDLTFDYALTTVVPWQVACRRGSALCRGTVTGDDWGSPEL